MPLVNYSSSASASVESLNEEAGQPPAKRRKGSGDTVGSDSDDPRATSHLPASSNSVAHGTDKDARNSVKTSTSSGSRLPPLPSGFFDLYASNARTSVVDDPNLHQGRKRQTPHVAGNWPTHLYIEWFPNSTQHDLLVKFIQQTESELEREGVKLHNFLLSDLGAPLPLHISLSRPITLHTNDKDAFLEKATTGIKSSGVRPFTVTPRGLAWYKSPDSDRTFLILRVTSQPTMNDAAAPNPELMSLLIRCNTTVATFNQPPLYQKTQAEAVGTAFHISIGWTFDLPGDEASLRALKLFKEKTYADMRKWEIEVPAIKIKIGNVVSHIPLTGTRADGLSSDATWTFER